MAKSIFKKIMYYIFNIFASSYIAIYVHGHQ